MSSHILVVLLAILVSGSKSSDDDFGFDGTDFDGKGQKPIESPFLEKDVTAIVGRIFSFVVPKDAFERSSKTYKAEEEGKPNLPYWLLFDKTDLHFWGIPSSEDIGIHHITITPQEGEKYSFKVIVTEDNEDDSKCPEKEDKTVLSLLIDGDVTSIKPLRKIVAVDNIAKFFGLPYTAFKWAEQDEPDNINDSSVMLAGPGNIKKRTSKETALIQVAVGCDGKMSEQQRMIVHQLKRQARDGTISEVLQLPLVGWRVKTETAPVLRRKREADVFGSGDYEEYAEYDGYDEYDYDDVSKTVLPEVVSSSTSTTTSTTTVAPSTSESHHHRHHHGEQKPSEEFEVSSETVKGDVLPVTVPSTSTEPTEGTVSTIDEVETTTTTTTTTTIRPETTSKIIYDEYDDLEDDDDDLEESSTIIPIVPSVIDQSTEPTVIILNATTTTEQPPTIEERQTTTETPTTTTSEPSSPLPLSTTIFTTTSTTTLAPTSEPETTTSRQTTRQLQKWTTTPTTETIYDMKNFPPSIQNRLQRLPVTAGKFFRFRIPRNTFVDMEDGNDLFLEFFDGEGLPIANSSWCQFNPKTKEIYGLPLDEDVSRWDFTIKATDKEGASVSEKLEILVQQHKAKRVVNHEFSLSIHLYHVFPRYVDWCFETLQVLSGVFKSNMSEFTVRKVEYYNDPVVITWTNDSLPTSYCPEKEIKELFNMLTANDQGDPSQQLKSSFGPELTPKKVTYQGLGVCETQPKTPVTPPTNFSPFLRNPIDQINATVGELLVYTVPDDTFYDPEDQDSRMLTLSLLTSDGKPLPSHHWLQFDNKNREFYGIPHRVGRTEYQLECRDSGGLPASDSLVIDVFPQPKLNYNVEFSMNILTRYHDFVGKASLQRKFVEKLQELFGDRNTSYIYLSNYNETKNGLVVTWYNKTLTSDNCPKEQIEYLESILKHNDQTVASRVHHIMEPDFPVSTIKVLEINACKIKKPEEVEVISTSTEAILRMTEETPTQTKSDEYLITFIVPAVVIAIMLLFAGLIALFLYRRRRTGKMNIEEDGRTSYGNKGIPVIFQEELDEKPEPGTKTPVILKEEKPPLAPPEYSKSGSLKLTDDSEPYQPPPPFTRTQDNGRQARPKPTPTYRKPPPYVPP